MMRKKLQRTFQSLLLFALLSITATSYSQIGSLNPSFDPDDGPDFQVNAALPLPDGKIMIGGSFSEYNTVSRNGIARINADGTLDATFDPGTGIPVIVGRNEIKIDDIKVQADGKIVIAGIFDTYSTVAKKDMARLNADGSLDASFTLDARIATYIGIRTIALQPDGKIIVTGSFNLNGTRKSVARLNADGSLDETFSSYITPYGLTNNEMYRSLVMPDGKILIAGTCQITANTFLLLTKLNPDGSRDTSFTPVTHTSPTTPVSSGGAITSLTLLPDGKILAGGGFNVLFGTVQKNNFIRLNANGTLDTTFTTGTSTGASPLNRVYSILLQADGKIVIAGAFNTYNGVARKGLARLNATGTLDNSFAVGTGFADYTAAYTASWLADGDVIVAGLFTMYNGTTRNRIAKISLKTITASPSEAGPFCAGAAFNVNYARVPADTAFNAGNIFTAQLSNAAGSFANPVNIGTLASTIDGTISVTIPRNTVAGTGYQIRVVSSSPVITGDKNATAIVIKATIAPTGTATQDFTPGQTLADFTVSGQNIIWYDAATGGNVLPPTHVIQEGVVYYASQTVDGCESFERLEITAGEELSTGTFNRNALKYYPNPADSFLNVAYSDVISSVEIYSLLGQKLVAIKTDSSTVKMNLEGLNSGMYLLKITSGNTAETVRIVKK